MGSSWLEPNQRLFRATAMDVPEYPGDIPCEEESGPGVDPKPTPEEQKQNGATKAKVAASKSNALPVTGDATPAVGAAIMALAGVATVAVGLRRRGA